MPYWFEVQKVKLPKDKDRRRKLNEEDKQEIKRLYFREGLAIREIARRFQNKCCRRMIQFILFPERYKRVMEWKMLRHWDYKRDRHTIAVRNHRRYKASVLGLKGKKKIEKCIK